MNDESIAHVETEPLDPRQRFAAPPFPQPKQDAPGSSNDLNPQADYGESTYRGSGRLSGRAALITGADSGIGRAVALCFAKEGADVLFAHLPEEIEDAEETVRLVEAAGRKAVAVAGDIRSKAFCQQLVENAMRTFDRLDILVNNAAFQRTHEKLEDIPEDEFDTTFRTNVYATFFLTQAALPLMKPGGVVLNTCSIEAYQPAGIARCLCRHEVCAGESYEKLRESCEQDRSQGQWGCAGAGLDAVDSSHDARRTGENLWQQHGIRAARDAG